jgi:hypothetical protein
VGLLRRFDGVGHMGAITILAEVLRLSAFERAGDVAAFADCGAPACFGLRVALLPHTEGLPACRRVSIEEGQVNLVSGSQWLDASATSGSE